MGERHESAEDRAIEPPTNLNPALHGDFHARQKAQFEHLDELARRLYRRLDTEVHTDV